MYFVILKLKKTYKCVSYVRKCDSTYGNVRDQTNNSKTTIFILGNESIAITVIKFI